MCGCTPSSPAASPTLLAEPTDAFSDRGVVGSGEPLQAWETAIAEIGSALHLVNVADRYVPMTEEDRELIQELGGTTCQHSDHRVGSPDECGMAGALAVTKVNAKLTKLTRPMLMGSFADAHVRVVVQSLLGALWVQLAHYVACGEPKTATCSNCGTEFVTLRQKTGPRYCSGNCRTAAHRKRHR